VLSALFGCCEPRSVQEDWFGSTLPPNPPEPSVLCLCFSVSKLLDTSPPLLYPRGSFLLQGLHLSGRGLVPYDSRCYMTFGRFCFLPLFNDSRALAGPLYPLLPNPLIPRSSWLSRLSFGGHFRRSAHLGPSSDLPSARLPQLFGHFFYWMMFFYRRARLLPVGLACSAVGLLISASPSPFKARSRPQLLLSGPCFLPPCPATTWF